MTSIFLTYARDDDEPFVRRLYEDLTANGFAVWYDRTNMPSRALTFHKEIRDAIDSSDRLIVVIGPKAIQSDYVRAEWQHALNACKIVIPVIRFGKRDQLPIELRKLNCPDMRETRPYADALADLLRVLGYPVVPLGELRGVPSLPAHFLPRPEFMEHLNNTVNTVLADVNHPVAITSAKRTTALQGMGGVGKSMLAAAFSRACETRRAFRDGVVWMTMGQQPDIARNLMALGQAFHDDLKVYIDIESGKARIAKVLADKNCLLVLDDIWDVKHAEAFVNALGTRCRLLITTRDGGLAMALGAQEHRLDVLSIEDAMYLLASYSGQPANEIPVEAHDVAQECGYLPFALALCGAMVSEGTPWNDLLESLRQADLSFLMKQFPNYPYPDVLKSLKVSVDALARTDPAWEKHYKELAVFPHTEAVPEETVIMFWIYTNGVNEHSARQLLITLERKALIRLVGKSPDRRVSMHELQHDYLCAMMGDLTGLHGELLKAYRKKCQKGWHTGPNDGYFFQRLVYHLVQTEKKDEVSALLFNFDWMLAKLKATDVIELIADYDTAQMLFPSYVDGKDKALRLVQGSLRLSAHILTDKGQLPSQLAGRLFSFQEPEIRSLLEGVREWKDEMWLLPLTASLTPPGGPLIRTLKGHTGWVLAVSVTPDGRHAISASDDNTLKVWDLESGVEIRTLKGHTNRVNAVSVTSDGRRAISASHDLTLKIWDLETGVEIRTLKGHIDWVGGVSVTPDGRRAISASSDNTLKVWDIESGIEIRTLKGHTGGVMSVSVTPDGKRAISASYDGTLKVWDIESGIEIRTLEGHTGGVMSISVTPDGRRAISASSDYTLKVWDMERGVEIRTLEGHTGGVMSVSVTPDGRRAISASSDNTLKVWDMESGIEIRTLRGHTGGVMSVSVTPDGRNAISASHDYTLKVWDMESGGIKIRTIKGHNGWVLAVSVTADGRCAISASSDNTLKVWDIESGIEIRTLRGHTGRVMSVSVTPDGRRAISASSDNTLKVWDIESGIEIRTLRGHTGGVMSVSVTPDGRRAISASDDNTLKVWDLESGVEIRTLKGHNNRVNAVSVTPDGRRAVSASSDNTLKVWDMETGIEIRTLKGHTGGVMSVFVTSDGRHAISGSDDNTLKVWDMENGVSIAGFSGDGPLLSITVTQDGKIIIVGEASGKVHFLRLDTQVPQVHYTNAKVVLVGDTGVGKSGLGLVLSGEPFVPTESTHGRRVWKFDEREVELDGGRKEIRETLLWDLAGQPGYRLIHQLQLSEVAMPLVVFDARSETDPFAGVHYWDRALRQAQRVQGDTALTMKKFLVSARTDRGGISVSRLRIDSLLNELGFDSYFETSAKEGKNIKELAEAIRMGINWGELPKVSSPELFQTIKSFLITEKEAGRQLSTVKDLYSTFLKSDYAPQETEELYAQFETCIRLIESRDLIKRLSFGNFVLLQPELLDSYASAIINQAKDEPYGMGCIAEEDAQEGRFQLSKNERIKDKEQEKLLLIATIENMLRHEIALREFSVDGVHLVFPSQFTREWSEAPDPQGKAVVFRFEGPLLNIYTTLAVRLSHSGLFMKKEIWKNAINYTARVGGTCGMFLREIEEGIGELTLFFDAASTEETRFQFEEYVQVHMQRRALPQSIQRQRIFMCHKCGETITQRQAKLRRELEHKTINCPICDTSIPTLTVEKSYSSCMSTILAGKPI